ncbi:MAG: nickel transporter [Rhizobiales bacterium]|nr:nickel transporter [Hyphomicrobiales bacterium]
MLLAGLHDVLAQGNPFGVGRPPAAPAGPGGFTGWLLAQQAQFYRGLSGAIRAAKADGTAVWGLFGLSFAYGVFHAAGPGHGKAVISSYLVANEETWRRGVVLSFASALLQALTAIVLVGIAAVLLNASAKTMGDAVRWIEIVSYALIVLVGARLVWVKGRAFLAALRAPPEAAVDHTHQHHHAHDHGHVQHHHHDHDHDDHHGHAHGPEPNELAGRGGWQRGLSAIVAVGLRPCSGAILVLVFALAQGLFWAGVGATLVMGLGTAITVAAIATLAVGARGLAARLAAHRGGSGVLIMRGLEVVASALVIAFGLLLLTGYMASERMFGF